MFITRVTCDASRPGMDMTPCPYLDVLADHPEDIPAAFTKTLTQAGWSMPGGSYYCPRHNPSLAGMPIVIGVNYIEPLPGLRIRATGVHEGAHIDAEILFDKTRYDLDESSPGMWRAKHVSEEWPT